MELSSKCWQRHLAAELGAGCRVFYLGGVDHHNVRSRRDIYELFVNLRWRKLPMALPVDVGNSRTFFRVGMEYCNGTTSLYPNGRQYTLHDMIGVHDKDYVVNE